MSSAMRGHHWVETLVLLFATTAAFAQTSTQPVVDAARASKLAEQSAPPNKVIRNKDIVDPNDTPDPAKAQKDQAAAAKAQQAARAEDAAAMQADRKFESQGKIFQNQIRVQKGKLIDIQNHIRRVKSQFAAWSAEYAQDSDAPVCWTYQGNSPYYKGWCDTGKNLKAEYDAAQKQLVQEKANLETMQENIRRQGYGNAVYDPD